ncbi:MAG: GTP-binding protein [Promethearchaeota archaeon]
MAVNIDPLFKKLFTKFLEIDDDIEAVIVSDQEGFVIAGEKRITVDMELVSVLTALINPILERIRNEFAFKKFGSSSFDTEKYRLLFISIDETITLTIVINTLGSIDKISPYAFFLAEKTAQILTAKEGDSIQLTIPNFEVGENLSEDLGRIREQVYQMRLDSGGKYKFKCVLIGDHEVGKTSIIRQFVEQKFSDSYRSTIGIDVMSHSIELYDNQIIFILYDIGAQEFFKRLRKTYYSGTQATFIVFDVTNKNTFLNVKTWYNEVKTYLKAKQIPIVIVGNKVDLEEERVVLYEEGVRLANELSGSHYEGGISYIETSALTGENIADAFSLIAYHYIMRAKDLEEQRLRVDLMETINNILTKNNKLVISFINKNPFWSPGLQILTEINKLCDCERIDDNKEKRIYEFSNGLVIKNFLFDDFEVYDSDGIFIIFDARDKKSIDPKWKDILVEIISNIKENKVILIGIRVSEETNWSQIMEQFNLNKYLEKKMISLLFFKIGIEYRLEIYDQLQVMLNTIKDLN